MTLEASGLTRVQISSLEERCSAALVGTKLDKQLQVVLDRTKHVFISHRNAVLYEEVLMKVKK